MTVKELIEALSKMPPEAVVEIKADCCSHSHSIGSVRQRGEHDWDDDGEVIIDVTEGV